MVTTGNRIATSEPTSICHEGGEIEANGQKVVRKFEYTQVGSDERRFKCAIFMHRVIVVLGIAGIVALAVLLN